MVTRSPLTLLNPKETEEISNVVDIGVNCFVVQDPVASIDLWVGHSAAAIAIWRIDLENGRGRSDCRRSIYRDGGIDTVA